MIGTSIEKVLSDVSLSRDGRSLVGSWEEMGISCIELLLSDGIKLLLSDGVHDLFPGTRQEWVRSSKCHMVLGLYSE